MTGGRASPVDSSSGLDSRSASLGASLGLSANVDSDRATAAHTAQERLAAEERLNAALQSELGRANEQYRIWAEEAARKHRGDSETIRSLRAELLATQAALSEAHAEHAKQVSLERAGQASREDLARLNASVDRHARRLAEAERENKRLGEQLNEANAEIERLKATVQTFEAAATRASSDAQTAAAARLSSMREEVTRAQHTAQMWEHRHATVRDALRKLEDQLGESTRLIALEREGFGVTERHLHERLRQLEQAFADERAKKEAPVTESFLMLHEKANHWLERYRHVKLELRHAEEERDSLAAQVTALTKAAAASAAAPARERGLRMRRDESYVNVDVRALEASLASFDSGGGVAASTHAVRSLPPIVRRQQSVVSQQSAVSSPVAGSPRSHTSHEIGTPVDGKGLAVPARASLRRSVTIAEISEAPASPPVAAAPSPAPAEPEPSGAMLMTEMREVVARVEALERLATGLRAEARHWQAEFRRAEARCVQLGLDLDEARSRSLA